MKKTLIALTTAATLAIGLSATGKADTIGFGFGFDSTGHSTFAVHVSDGPHFGHGFYDPPVYDAGYGAGYDDSEEDAPACHTEWVPQVRWNAWHTYRVKTVKKIWICD